MEESLIAMRKASAQAQFRFLNIRLDGISVEDPERHPHMVRESRRSTCYSGRSGSLWKVSALDVGPA